MAKNERTFSLADADLLQHAEKVATALPGDMDDFANFDTTLTPSYPETIEADLAKFRLLKTDDVVIDEMAELTLELNSCLAKCNSAYRTIAFFVRKAFPNNTAIQNQFGLNDIKKARGKQAKMVVFMETLSQVAQKYSPEITTAGCNPAVIDSLAPLAEELRLTNIKQEKFKNERGLITQERVSQLNNLYKLVAPISEIAHIIYADNPAKLDLYALPRPLGSSNSSDDLIVS